jgi:hypothetical protein
MGILAAQDPTTPWRYMTAGSRPFEFGLRIFEDLARVLVRKLINGLRSLCGQGATKAWSPALVSGLDAGVRD